MNKKIYLLIVTALTAGLLAGHVIKSCEQGSIEKKAGAMAKRTGADSRFGDKHALPSYGNSSLKMPTQEEASDIDQLIGRYARMKGDELLVELKKLEAKMEKREDCSGNVLYDVLHSYLCLKLGQTLPRQALLHIRNTSREPQARHYIMTGWKEKNPDAVLAYCTEQEKAGNTDMQLSSMQASLMAAREPDRALDKALATNSMEKNWIIRQVLAQFIDKNPQKMAEAVKKAEKVVLQNEWTYQGIAGDWARSDWDSAMQWINGLPEDKKRKAMASAIASLPLEQATLHLPDLDGKEKEAAIYQITADLVYKSPRKALEWLIGNASEEVAVSAITRLGYSRQLLSSEVSQYVDRMPSGKIKDSILEKMVERMKVPSRENEFWDMGEKDIIDAASKMSSQEKSDEIINSLKKNLPLRFGNRAGDVIL